MDLLEPLRPSDYQDFSQSLGEIGPYFTITFDLWINSIRTGKAFVFRIGNLTIERSIPMMKRDADELIADNQVKKDDSVESTRSCGHEMPSVSTKDDFSFNDCSARVRSISFESAIWYESF